MKFFCSIQQSIFVRSFGCAFFYWERLVFFNKLCYTINNHTNQIAYDLTHKIFQKYADLLLVKMHALFSHTFGVLCSKMLNLCGYKGAMHFSCVASATHFFIGKDLFFSIKYVILILQHSFIYAKREHTFVKNVCFGFIYLVLQVNYVAVVTEVIHF